MCHPLGNLWVMYTVHLWLVGKRVIDFLLVLTELFSPAVTVETLWADNGCNCGVRKGEGVSGSLWAQILGERQVRPPTTVDVRKLDSLGYQVAFCVILRLAILINRYNTVVWQTHTHTHMMTANTGASQVPHG